MKNKTLLFLFTIFMLCNTKMSYSNPNDHYFIHYGIGITSTVCTEWVIMHGCVSNPKVCTCNNPSPTSTDAVSGSSGTAGPSLTPNEPGTSGNTNFFVLESGSQYTVGIDLINFYLVIKNKQTGTTTMLLGSDELNTNFGVSATGEELWLGFGITLDETQGTLDVSERSVVWENTNSTSPATIATEQLYSYSLSTF